MGWNYRILAHQHDHVIDFQIHEVYYDKENNPISYTSNPVSVTGESIKSINWTLNKMKVSLMKPIIWAGDKFPNIYTYKK